MTIELIVTNASLPEGSASTKMTKLGFKNRFPREKWKAARSAAAVNADLADFFESFELATYIDLSLIETILAVNAMADVSIPETIRLTQEEVDAILLNMLTPGEMFIR